MAEKSMGIENMEYFGDKAAAAEALENAGINMETGLEHSGSEKDYFLLLKIFYDAIDKNTEDLIRLYEDGDIKNYIIKIHGLKSSARIIGATDFGEMAQRLENAGKADDMPYLHDQHESFLNVYGSFKKPLSALFAEEKSSESKPEADAALMKKAFDEFKAAAGDMDCNRLDAMACELEAYSIPADKRELYSKIASAIEQYDYAAIVKLLS